MQALAYNGWLELAQEIDAGSQARRPSKDDRRRRSSSRSRLDPVDLADGDVPSGGRLVGTIHSHGGFGAYASSIDEDDEAELDGLHVVVGDFDRRRLGYSAAIVVDGIRFSLKTGQLIERPRRLAEPPDEWLRKVRLAPPPRPKGKPSMAEYLTRGFKPSDEISKPSRRELDDAIEKASKLATALGYRLSYWLVPISGPGEKGGTADG